MLTYAHVLCGHCSGAWLSDSGARAQGQASGRETDGGETKKAGGAAQERGAQESCCGGEEETKAGGGEGKLVLCHVVFYICLQLNQWAVCGDRCRVVCSEHSATF